ncbi:hypothetical protein Ancab_023594 [Ancistrocladus abbreviatus]
MSGHFGTSRVFQAETSANMETEGRLFLFTIIMRDIGEWQMDAYLLCKILKKSGPGFKPGEQYGPFIEEEWDKEDSALVPGEEAEDDALGNDDARVEDSTQSINDSRATRAANSVLSREIQDVPPLCKIEKPEDCPVAYADELFPLVPGKRLRHERDSSHSNASEISTTRTQGPCSSSTATTNFSSALLDFPGLEPAEPKERRSTLPINIIDINVPPSYLKLFEDLRNEIYRISIEKESLKIEVMSARTMINILQSKIEHLNKENEDLKKIAREARDARDA